MKFTTRGEFTPENIVFLCSVSQRETLAILPCLISVTALMSFI